MAQEHQDLPEFEELEPLSDSPPPPSSRAPQAAGAPAREKRNLERAPLLLRKASKILIAGALFPFFTALIEGFSAWLPLYLGKAVAGLACWLAYQGYMATHGGKPLPLIAKLAQSHRLVVPILSAVVALLALVPALTSDWKGSMVSEIATLILGGLTLVHIWAYEHGGKFNPIFPLMFLGPGIAGLLNVFGAMGRLRSDPALGAVALIGNVIVAAGGLYAMYVMFQSIRQAKAEGDLKREQLRLARKAERDVKKRDRPGSSPSGG